MTGYIAITCSCGHKADMDEFCRTLIGGELPPGHFQCPACRRAWKRQESGYRVLTCADATMIIPDRVEIVPVEARL